MIQGIGGTLVRITSFVFPQDNQFPRVLHALEPPLAQEPPEYAVEAPEMITLYFSLQTRFVSIHTNNDAIAWNSELPHAVQVRFQNNDDSQSVSLAIAQQDGSDPQAILRTDQYSLALLGRYRLLADTIATWTGRYAEVVEEPGEDG